MIPLPYDMIQFWLTTDVITTGSVSMHSGMPIAISSSAGHLLSAGDVQ